MQKLSEATQQKLADANAVAEADAPWVGIWDGQLQLDEIDDPRHPDVWDFRKTLDILMYLVPNLYDTRDGHKKHKHPNHLGWSEHSHLVGYCNFKIKWLAGWCHINIETGLWRMYTSISSMIFCKHGMWCVVPMRWVLLPFLGGLRLRSVITWHLQRGVTNWYKQCDWCLEESGNCFGKFRVAVFFQFVWRTHRVCLEGRMHMFAFHLVVLHCLLYWYVVVFFW